jgi:hypothetical protein
MNNRFKVLASYNLVQYVLHFKLLVVFVKVSKCPKSLNLTNIVLVDLVGACRLEGYPYCGNACSCDGSVCDQDEGRGSEEECVTSSGSSLRTYFPRHLMRV